MDNKFISIKVSENPDPNDGFGSLIMFNNPRFELKDVFYGGFESNSFYYSIRIDQSQVVYKIIKNNVRSHGVIRAGALSLAFSIPKGYKVDGYKPYEVLMDLLYTFLKNCMTCRDEIADTYEFNDVRVPLDALDETAKKYTLTESESPWRTMSNDARIGCIQAEEIQIEQLINDVQYDEFEKYSEVLIAENVGDNCTFSRITGLEIPRRPVYTIVVDGKPYQKTNEVDKTFTIKPEVDSCYYEGEPIKFTISDLLDGDYVEGVVPNRIAEIINVSTASYKHPREFNIRVVFTPEENKAAEYLDKGQIAIKYDIYNVSLDKNYMFTLRGEEYKFMNRLDLFKITVPESLEIEFEAMPTFDPKKNELQWKTKKKEKPKAINTSTVTSLVSTRDNNHKTETHSSDVFKLVFVVEKSTQNQTIIESIDRGKSKLVVKNDALGETVTVSKNISHLTLVKIISQGKGKKCNSNAGNNSTYLGDEIKGIPKPLNQNMYNVELHIGNKKYTTDFDYFEEKYVDGYCVVKFSDFKQIPKPIKNVIMPNRVIAFLEGVVLCALLIGGRMIIKSFFDNDNKTSAVQGTREIVLDSVTETTPNVFVEITDDSIRLFLDKSDSILKKKDLSFNEVDTICQKYKNNIDRCRNINNEVCNRIDDYYNLVNLIKNGKYLEITKIEVSKLHLYNKHLILLESITRGKSVGKNKYHRYNKEEIEEIQKLFKESYREFKNFSNLNDFVKKIKTKEEKSIDDNKEKDCLTEI